MEKIGVLLKSGSAKTLIVYGNDIVNAPPAFKGQQSRKGATNARFAMVAARILAAKNNPTK